MTDDHASDEGLQLHRGAGALPVGELSPLAALLAGAAGGIEEDLSPLYWPGVDAAQAAGEWESLREWVTRLVRRFDFDYRTLPKCWYRHNAHVEALVALRDCERACFAESAAPTAGIEWHRALRDIEARLREWTSRTNCLSQHRGAVYHAGDASINPERVTPEDDFPAFVEQDVAARRQPGSDGGWAVPGPGGAAC